MGLEIEDGNIDFAYSLLLDIRSVIVPLMAPSNILP